MRMILTAFDAGRPIYGGLDLASTTDITAWAMVQQLEKGYRANWHFWIPKERAVRAEQSDRVPYREWAKQGFITLTDGARADYPAIKNKIVEDCTLLEISHVGYDPWNAEYMRQQLEDSGIQMIQVRQGFATLSEPCKHMEAAIADHAFDHGNNPVAEWMAENVEVKVDDNGNIRPIKPGHNASGKRIDGIAAVIVAIAVSLEAPTALAYDYYDENELEIV